MSVTPSGRNNGLPAAAVYVALVDVDPPVADHVLALLATAGVPAVAEPLAGETGPYQDTRPPARPTERVYVDRDRTQLAREVVAGALPALRGDFHADAARRADADVMRTADVDKAFAAIVADFGTKPVEPEPDPTYWEEDHFVPPEPPPLPETDVITRFAWFGLVGGPLALVLGVVIGIPWRPWMVVLALSAFIGGFVTLVAGMPDRRPEDDGDDGAVV